MEEFATRFALSREAVRAAALFWRECDDLSLRRRQRTKLNALAAQAGHGDIKSLFS